MELESTIATCVLSTKPDTRCTEADGYCDENVAVVCIHGYEISREDCSLPKGSPSPSVDASIDASTPVDASAVVAPKGGTCMLDTPYVYNGVGRISAYCRND